MNSNVNDVTHCQICFDPFGSHARCPHMLHCGHTFCHSCLQRFISEGSVCPTCKEEIPFVSANNIPINFSVKSLSENDSKTNDSPSVMNDTLEAAALTNNEEFLVVKKVTKKKELPYEGHCEEHCLPNHFECIKCNKFICGTCVVLIHNECPKSLPVLEALNFMRGEKLKMIKVFQTKLEIEALMLDSQLDQLNRKQEKFYQEIQNAEEEIKNVKAEVKKNKSKKEINKKRHEDSTCHEETLEKANCNEDYEKANAKVNFFFEENCIDNLLPSIIRSKEDAMKLTLKHLQENTFYVTKTDDETMKYSKVKVEDDQISFGEWEEVAEGGSSCVDLLDFINSRTVVIDTHKFIEEHKKELHNPRLPKDKIKFSQIEVKEKEVYFSSFKTSNESDFVFKFGSLVKTLGCSSVVPKEAFLKIQMLLEEREFVITTDRGSPRAINFLLLASGIMDDSYQGTSFGSNDSYVDGGFKNGFNFFPGVVEGIQNAGIYEREESKRGDVRGWKANEPNELSFFWVCKEDDFDPSTTTFGRVRRGMEVVDQIDWRESVMTECGLIFDLSKSDGF